MSPPRIENVKLVNGNVNFTLVNPDSNVANFYADLFDPPTTFRSSNIVSLNNGVAPNSSITVQLPANQDSIIYAYSESTFDNNRFDSQVVEQRFRPDAPTTPTITNITLLNSRRVSLTWTDTLSPFQYVLEISTQSNFATLITGGTQLIWGLSRTVQIPAEFFAYSTTHYFRLAGVYDGFQGDFSNVVNVTTLAQPAIAPPEIVDVQFTGSLVSFGVINRHTEAVDIYANVTVPATSPRAFGVLPNKRTNVTDVPYTSTQTTVYARSAISSTFSDNTALTFDASTLPAIPVLTAGGLTALTDAIQIEWTYQLTDPFIDGFFIERNPNFQGAASFGIITDTVPSEGRVFIDNRILGNQTYEYRVVARNSRGTRTSSTQSITTTGFVPAVPTINAAVQTTAISASQGSTTVRWQRNSTDEDGFIVQFRDTSISATFTDITGAAAGSSSVQVVFERSGDGGPTRPYGFRVRAFNEFGESADSSEHVVFL